ncbi:uncharacterized protein BDR25DRAFT_334111 [Lindgomyces ingoldianus]|uniref:Uncharacterized protein n=1 Tax=Lindgomyces ingoldianus TaxID=673940 RepID=A0ACB6QVC8_9PLEO|nr:uncharacterized protein BDR25DRAFT_334111 [Lindgomyces ingoldianus]KAF2470943.1 hypothetical protein BDR25DRAFT_334111 [Lindgomyces ingoldianus]
MSTFKGIIHEFPQIRIDYFRHQPDHRPPLACFLSHVHSDHLIGLESLRAPFVYCSAATREILLRLEKYYHRVNFSRRILESRTVTYGKHMGKLAKPLPLETPTVIELSPGNEIRVTLFDANHCVGAVMFLIEGGGKAVLYTGDIRAETWWVNTLVQNPVLLPYTLGLRRLDCIYLDTTFATKSEPYCEFPSKAEGICELLQKVGEYPEDTIFYFHSWTFGYENVWIALSTFLRSQIHVDTYRFGIYSSLSPLKSGVYIREAPTLCGFMNGNHEQHGCLTSQPDVRLHSCERGMGCPVVDRDTDARVVHIIPIVTRTHGTEIAEVGAGGGKGDLDQIDELEAGDVEDVGKLIELCASKIKDQELLSKVVVLLQQALNEKKGRINLGMGLQKESQGNQDDLSLQTLISVLSTHIIRTNETEEQRNETIHFPYSRHSSFSELCTLVSAFKPRDIYPCTMDEDNWTPALGMRNLFGEFCSANVFRHDTEMMEVYELRTQRERTQRSEGISDIMDHVTPKRSRTEKDAVTTERHMGVITSVTPADSRNCSHHTPNIEAGHADIPMTSTLQQCAASALPIAVAIQREHDVITMPDSHPRPGPSKTQYPNLGTPLASLSFSSHRTSISSTEPKISSKSRQIAYNAALGIDMTWLEMGGLVSTRKENEEKEL